MLNGEELPLESISGHIRIEKKWKQGDVVTLMLPMEISVRTWAENKNSVSVDYGPLTFSLKIAENWIISGGTEQWPEWEIYPASSWNYGLDLDLNNPATSFEVIRKGYPASEMPFTPENSPIEIRATGKKIPAWTVDENFLVNELPVSPVITDQVADPIVLIPMGAARLRISSFPIVNR